MSKNIEQRTPEWFAQRKGKITGSVAGAALGLNPYMTASQLIRRMVREYHNLESEFTGNIATEYGTLHEPIAIMDYINKTGCVIDEVGFIVHPEHKWLGASPDGIATNLNNQKYILEVKCPFGLRDNVALDFKTIEQQPHYYVQTQIEMACTGIKQAHFYQWNKYGDSLEIVTFNKAWFDEAVVKLFAFYELYLHELKNKKHLEPLIPEIDTPKAHALITQYDALSEVIDNATQQKAEVLAELTKLCNDKNAVICGRKLTQVKRDGAISYAKAFKDLMPDADLTKYKGQPTTFWKLS